MQAIHIVLCVNFWLIESMFLIILTKQRLFLDPVFGVVGYATIDSDFIATLKDSSLLDFFSFCISAVSLVTATSD